MDSTLLLSSIAQKDMIICRYQFVPLIVIIGSRRNEVAETKSSFLEGRYIIKSGIVMKSIPWAERQQVFLSGTNAEV